MCWAFGAVAGIEGFYKRVYGTSVVLSENYAVHYRRMSHVHDGYFPGPDRNNETNSSWYDNMGNSQSVLSDSQYGRLPEARFAPFVGADLQDQLSRSLLGVSREIFGNWNYNPPQEQIDTLDFAPEHIPPEARLHASYGVNGYSHVPGGADITSRLESAIASNHEVVADFNFSFQWDGSMWQWQPNASPAGHVMLIVGYDRTAGVFTVRNSWGTGVASQLQWMPISYDAMTHAFADGWVIDSVAPPAPSPQLEAAWLGEWVVGFEGRLFVRRFATDSPWQRSDGRVKIGDFYSFSDGAKHDVEGRIGSDGTLSYFIGPANVRLAPGSTSPNGDDHSAAIRVGDPDEGAVATFSGFAAPVTLDRNTRGGGLIAAQLVAVQSI